MAIKVKQAKDLSTNEIIYFKGHAQATYLSDGTTVEDAINNIESGSGNSVDPSNYYTKTEIDGKGYVTSTQLEAKQDVISDIDTIRTNASNYKGTITGVSANGTSVATSGVANIPAASTSTYGVTKLTSATNSTSTVLAATASAVKAAYDLADGKQDALISGTNIKTINGNSILGSGDITISGGSSSGSAYSEVSHGTADTTFELTPNTFHVWDEVTELDLSLGAETAGVANEYLFQFTSGSTATTLSLPDDIKWANDDAPTIETDKIYQISILKGLGSVLEWNIPKVLIDNLCTYNGRTTVTFQYPVASDVTVYIGNSVGMLTEVPVSAGETTGTLGTFPEPGSGIYSISPTRDGSYNYIF